MEWTVNWSTTMKRNNVWTVILLGLALAATGCGQETPAPAPAEAAGDAAAPPLGDTERSAGVLPLPGEQPAAPSPTAEGPLRWKVPDGWEQVPPASSMRIAQYRVPGPGGDGEMAVFYFGQGQGGDPTSNAVRWARQFVQPDGRPSEEVMTMTEVDGTAMRVRLVEVTGTYDGGMTMTDAPAEKLDGHMLLGTIAETPQGPWFFKLTGPEATLRSQRENLVAMMRSLGGGS
jgi:hypothetical protein